MAKAGRKPLETPREAQPHMLTIRGTPEWKAWLEQLQALCGHRHTTDTIDLALSRLAIEMKAPTPPKRF